MVIDDSVIDSQLRTNSTLLGKRNEGVARNYQAADN